MANLLIPRRWSFKPPLPTRIDRALPLTQGLIGLWLVNEGGGAPTSPFTAPDGSNPMSGTVASQVSWTNGPYGSALTVNSGFIAAGFTTSSYKTGYASGSIAWRWLWNASPTNGAISKGWGANSGGNIPELAFTKWSDNNCYIGWITLGNDARIVIAASSVITQAVWQFFVLTWNATGSILYRNGVQIGSHSGGPSVQTLPNNFGWMGTAGDGAHAGMPTGSLWDYGAMWNRALSATEVSQLSAEPYSLVATPPWWRRLASPPATTTGSGRSQVVIIG